MLNNLLLSLHYNNQLKQSKMKNYLITFVTLDGNEQGVYVSATSKERAILKFESEYEFEAVKFCEEAP